MGEVNGMKKKRYKTKVRALEIPKLAQYILLIEHCASVFFSRCKEIIPLLTHKGELRNQLFYVEKSLKTQLALFPSKLSEKMNAILKKVRR